MLLEPTSAPREELAEPLPLAVRAFELQQRFSSRRPRCPTTRCSSRGSTPPAANSPRPRHLDWVREQWDLGAAPPITRVLLRLCAQLAQGGGGQGEAWEALIAEAWSASLLSERIEIFCFAAADALHRGRREEAVAAQA
ncbi:hypothetical protein [Sorangium sp. So ce1078]|uniref:hypothetical protein n=1 Tax=Sorangium sp. So ce1078 TaxID=3133329 RepID=UPI003F62309F